MGEGKKIFEWLEEVWNVDEALKKSNEIKYNRNVKFSYEYFKESVIKHIDDEINRKYHSMIDYGPTINELEEDKYYKNIINGDIIYIIERHDGDVSQYEYDSLIHGRCMDLVDCFKKNYIEYLPTKEEKSKISM